MYNDDKYLSLYEWSKLVTHGKWKLRRFDAYLFQLLEYAMQGRISNILLSIPSRHGKSTLISENFCSYFLSHYPEEKVILSAYSQKLASQFGGKVKDIINTYGEWTPEKVRLSNDSHAKDKFNIQNHNGQMLAVGASGSILGFGAGLFIIDDPIKNIADADSEVNQEKLADWYHGVVKSRLERRSDGKPPILCVIAQRLHVHDLHGIILDKEPYFTAKEVFDKLRTDNDYVVPQDTWVYLNLPAICTNPEDDLLGREVNQVLWEKQRDYDWLMGEKAAMGSYLFNAIYQGEPTERDGNIFKREWFMNPDTNEVYRQITDVPDGLPMMRYWDFGASGKKGDATAGALTAWDGTNLYILDINTGKYSASQVLSTFERTALHDGKEVKIRIEQEPGAGSKLLINQFRRNPTFKQYNIRGDKVKIKKNIRSFNLEALAEAGRIYWKKASWNMDIIDHLVSFTGQDGKPDDITDSLTGSCNIWRRGKAKINV